MYTASPLWSTSGLNITSLVLQSLSRQCSKLNADLASTTQLGRLFHCSFLMRLNWCNLVFSLSKSFLSVYLWPLVLSGWSSSDSRTVIHYDDVIMGAIASQITSPMIVYRLFRRRSKKTSKLRGTGPGNSPHKWPVTRKVFPFHDVIMRLEHAYGSYSSWVILYASIMSLYTFCKCSVGRFNSNSPSSYSIWDSPGDTFWRPSLTPPPPPPLFLWVTH